jgi:hypothetical protein
MMTNAPFMLADSLFTDLSEVNLLNAVSEVNVVNQRSDEGTIIGQNSIWCTNQNMFHNDHQKI